jgi:hypothetical protein
VEVTSWIEEFMGNEFFVIGGSGTATDCSVQAENKTADKVRRIRKGRGDCFVAPPAPLAMTG